jgi:hypothetical protein
MNRSQCRAAFACVTALAIAVMTPAGCSSTEPGTQSARPLIPVAASPTGIVICGGFHAYTPQGKPYVQPEWYSLSAINNKLRHFPSMAAEIGMQPTVSDCAGARQFVRRYDAYWNVHPHFDAREPIELPAFPPHTPPPAPRPEVAKVFNGLPLQEDPVIEYVIVNTNPANLGLVTGGCTGTFIAKNWIATAAHCMALAAPGDHLFDGITTDFNGATLGGVDEKVGVGKTGMALPDADIDATDDQLTEAGIDCAHLRALGFDCASLPLVVLQRIYGWFQYQITWAGANGQQITSSAGTGGDPNLKPQLTAWVKQYPDPRFVGISEIDINAHDGDFDFALVYVYSDFYDPVLPPSATGGSATGAAMRLSLVGPTTSGFDLTFGFGRTGTSIQNTLQGLLMQIDTNNLFPYSFQTVQQTTDAGPALCPGDSGSPTVRFSTITGANPGGMDLVPVVEGVAHTISKQDPVTHCGNVPPDVDANLPGEVDTYARTDVETNDKATGVSWVEIAMQDWNGPNFQCRKVTSNGASGQDVAECWGLPCKQDSDCNDPKFFCQRYTPDGVNSKICPTCPDKTCSCIVGQCLLREGFLAQ